MDSKIIIETQTRLSELKNRAARVGYKCLMPTLPTFRKEIPEVHISQMSGFNKRLHNWERGLLSLENPSGMPQPEQVHSTKILEGVNIMSEQ